MNDGFHLDDICPCMYFFAVGDNSHVGEEDLKRWQKQVQVTHAV